MQFQRPSQNSRRGNVVLNPAPKNQKQEYHQQMVVSRDESNSQDQHSTHKRSYDRNKLQGPGGRAECKSVGNTEDPDHGSHHRSEERRVGKEGRARWSPNHEKKNEST